VPGEPRREEDVMERIEAELLIPGRGEPVTDGVVVFDGPVITYAGAAGDAPATPGARVHRTETVMPGMWDCHGHFLGTRTLDLGKLPLEPVPLRAARCAHDLVNALDAGITSVREVGGMGIYLSRAVTEGVLDGPAIYAAGSILSSTGGHADLHSYPLAWAHDFGQHYGELRMADGEAECMRAVRERSPGWLTGRSPPIATANPE
jgi:imidazolonepropionase-like amidohydrolase